MPPTNRETRDLPRPPRLTAGVALFVLSAALLALEILDTRLFAYCFDGVMLYGAIGITLLGLGSSGTALALWGGWRRLSVGTLGAAACAGFAVSVVVAHMLLARVSSGLQVDLSPRALAVFTVLASPYFFAGIGVTASLAAAGTGVHRAYFANLTGSAAGCFVVFFALKSLGAPLLLGATALLGIVAGILYLRCGAGARVRIALTVAAAIAAVPTVAGERLFPFRRVPPALAFMRPTPAHVERLYDAWDPTGRIEIHRLGDQLAEVTAPIPFYFWSQDGAAGSVLLGVENDLGRAAGFFERTLYGAGYALRGGGTGASILVIGLGGGPDVQAAHFFAARSVTAVDINASAIGAIAGPFAAFTGNPYGRPNTRTVHSDGRTFVRSTTETFDLIVMSGVDTQHLFSAGALSLSENHLYTVEAFEEYFARLVPGGLVALLRFGLPDRLRLAAIGVAALRARGVTHPERHFAILDQQAWSSVLIGRDPLTEQAIERLAGWAASIPQGDTGIRLPPYEPMLSLRKPPRLLYPAGNDGARASSSPSGLNRDVGDFFAAVAGGREAEFIADVPINVSPTTDDRPFYFDLQRRDRLLTEPSLVYQRLGGFLAIMGVLALVGIAAPVPILRRGAASKGLLRTLVYFASIGTGFMLLEIALVQKLVLFLGDPAYSVTVVLAALLVWAGIGSAAAGGWQGPRMRIVRRRAVPAILACGLALGLWLDPVTLGCAGLPLGGRLVVVAAVLAPLGFALGVPFPTALAALAATRTALLPWAIGANGFASVIAASAAIPATMLFGYRAMLASGLCAYVVAAGTFPSEPDHG